MPAAATRPARRDGTCPMFLANTPHTRCSARAPAPRPACRPPRARTVCFVGDSLGRQLMIHAACAWATTHEFSVAGHEPHVHVSPAVSRAPGGLTLLFSGLLCHLPTSDGDLRAALGRCDAIILSKGAWHINNPTFALDEPRFDEMMTRTIVQLRRVLPGVDILLKPMWAWGETNCTTRSDYNRKIPRFNRVLANIPRAFPGVEIIGHGALYDASVMHNCLHPVGDPVHWCHANNSFLDAAVCMLSAQLG